ncbi:hypothetical protein E4T47_05119 [Aureobasidium subglaciale]|nr:hypothetical protein E4T47_05119 [Aureobasidium subglaciale]
MHFSILTVASASILAAGTNAIDVSEVPGYEAIPTASINKYLNDAGPIIPDFAVNSLEPTYMPKEDLYPSSISARSLTTTPTTVSAASVSDEPADESFEAFLQWMQLRQAQGHLDQDEHTKVVRDASFTSAQQTQTTNGPADGSYGAFMDWMNYRFPSGFAADSEPKLSAREVPAQPEASTAAAEPSDESFITFVEWMELRFPQGLVKEKAPELSARDVSPQPQAIAGADETADDSYDAFVARMHTRYTEGASGPSDHSKVARSLTDHEDEDLYGNYEFHARSEHSSLGDYDDETYDWSQVYDGLPLVHARSLEDADYANQYDQESSFDPHSEADSGSPYDESFEESLIRYGQGLEDYQQEDVPTESHEENSQPQAPANISVPASSISASPAAAPTPKSTSAGTSSEPVLTSASQWSDVASGTSTASSSIPTVVQARSYGDCIFCNQLYHKS